jgi:catechol 2,3-dioxygenase-like lactoylglutathione lyase family enzyme
MRSGVDHIIVNVNDYAAAKKFYAWLMPQIGYPKVMSYDQADTDVTTGFFGDDGSIWLRPSDPEFRGDKFHRHRVGLCEIAFEADSRAQIDDLAKQIPANGGTVTDPPKEYDYLPGYYSVFFTDPDGLKLELVHVPH